MGKYYTYIYLDTRKPGKYTYNDINILQVQRPLSIKYFPMQKLVWIIASYDIALIFATGSFPLKNGDGVFFLVSIPFNMKSIIFGINEIGNFS